MNKIKLFFILSILTSIAYMREKDPHPFFQETSYPVAELYAAKNDNFDFFTFLNKTVKAIVEGPYVEVQSIYTYKNTMDHLVAAEFEFPQIETDISHKVEIRYQGTVRLIFDEVNSPKKEYSKENPYTKERFSYKEIQAGNVRAQDIVEVIFTVMRPLKVNLNQFYELSIDPRHMPRFTTLSSPFFKTNCNLQIELKSERPFAILANPTHQLQPELSNHTDFYKAFYNATLYGCTLFTEEFKIYFASADFNAPQTIMGTHPFNPHDHAFMLSLVPDMNYFPSCVWYSRSCYPSFRTEGQSILQNLSDPDNFSNLKKAARQSELHYFANEYLFVIDRSESMNGPRLENLKKTLNILIGVLSESPSFYSFLSIGNSSQLHWEKSEGYVPYKTSENATEIMKWVETIEADMGEKDLLGALKFAFEEYEWTRRPKSVIILTDGKVTNADEIIQLVQANSHAHKICAIGDEGENGDILQKIGAAGGCPIEIPWWSEYFHDRFLDVFDATFTPPEFNLAYEVTCENEQNETVHQEEGGSDGIPKDKAFIKWVTLNNIPNLKSCKAKIFYFSQHRCSSSSYEEIEIFRSEKAQLTDTWHKVADYVKLFEPQVEESKRQFMVNFMQEDPIPVLNQTIKSFLWCTDPKRPKPLLNSGFDPSYFPSRHEEESFFSFKIICIASVLTLLFVAGLFLIS